MSSSPGARAFLGSHLCDFLIERGDYVTCVDNLSTGRLENIAHLLDHPSFVWVEADVTERVPHWYATSMPSLASASPASPPDYHRLALETLHVGSRGTEHALEVAAGHNARFRARLDERGLWRPDCPPAV